MRPWRARNGILIDVKYAQRSRDFPHTSRQNGFFGRPQWPRRPRKFAQQTYLAIIGSVGADGWNEQSADRSFEGFLSPPCVTNQFPRPIRARPRVPTIRNPAHRQMLEEGLAGAAGRKGSSGLDTAPPPAASALWRGWSCASLRTGALCRSAIRHAHRRSPTPAGGIAQHARSRLRGRSHEYSAPFTARMKPLWRYGRAEPAAALVEDRRPRAIRNRLSVATELARSSVRTSSSSVNDPGGQGQRRHRLSRHLCLRVWHVGDDDGIPNAGKRALALVP